MAENDERIALAQAEIAKVVADRLGVVAMELYPEHKPPTEMLIFWAFVSQAAISASSALAAVLLRPDPRVAALEERLGKLRAANIALDEARRENTERHMVRNGILRGALTAAREYLDGGEELPGVEPIIERIDAALGREP